MNSMLPTSNTPLRDEKEKTRRYITVDLSHRPTNEGKGYHCWDCGFIVATINNEPSGIAEVKIDPPDATDSKIVGNLCKKCNIMYFFV